MNSNVDNTLPENDSIDIDNVKDDHPWSVEHEKILVEWADKAMCYRWLHARSNLSYSRANAWFTIPVIIMSTLTGTANFAFQSYQDPVKSIASNVIGGVNILAAILSTIAQFLKISELNEAHRVSSISWDKFYRNIKVELAKHPDERIHASHMLKISKEEFDRLMEVSPMIKDSIILEFKHTFAYKNDLPKRDAFQLLKKPEICDELVTTDDFRHQWFREEKRVDEIEIKQMNEITKRRKNIEHYEKLIEVFRVRFNNEHDRNPFASEIIDNLKESIPENILNDIIEKHNNMV
uniref:SMODS and SLOG-associating 2TM effector domain-containing protein n=1 Tax=viral metagenome TaxID=1070528 RepID=A0A6C0DA65_9ZZZZ